MDGQRYFFCHMQKTGGTSLLVMLQRHFGSDAVYPSDGDGDPLRRIISLSHLRAQWATRRDQIRVVTGHFPLCTRELLGGGFRTFTVLREPVARTLSFLRHHRRLTPADRDKPLEQIYDERRRFQMLVHNHMVKMLSLAVDDVGDGALTPVTFTPEHLQRAMQQLTTVDVVGVQHRFTDFCHELHERFGFGLGEMVFGNRTPPVAVPRAFRDRIASDNALDVELFEFACRLVDERRGPRRSSAP